MVSGLCGKRRGGGSLRTFAAWSLAGLWTVACGGGEVAGPGEGEPDPPPPPASAAVVWPLSGAATPDADSVHAPFGPRALPSAYDFHAGIDLPAPTGTRVGAVLPGVVVQVRSWDGSSTGAGNAVLVAHAEGVHTSYLHLHTVAVRVGDVLGAGGLVGTVGSTGASYSHLHLGCFRNLPASSGDERYAIHPLEVLPFSAPSGITSRFEDDRVVVDLPLKGMSVRTAVLHGEGRQVDVDYYKVLLRGSTARDEHVQNGVFLDAGRPSRGRFALTLRAESPSFVPSRVVLLDFRGDTVHEARR